MAIKFIHKDETTSSKKKPLVREFAKEQLAKGNDIYDKSFIIRQLKPSKNNEWLVAESDHFVALINSESILGEALHRIMYSLKGKGHALVIIPERKGKLGFSVGIDDEMEVFYSQGKDDNTNQAYLWASNNNKKAMENKESIFCLENILIPENSPPNLSEEIELIPGTPEWNEHQEYIKKIAEKHVRKSRNGAKL